MKDKILAFLKAQDGFVSGQDICQRLGVSRTAIWKYMNALRQEGYEIESVTRKGYRLLQSPDLLTPGELAAWLPEGVLGGEIHCYESIDSTNQEAKRAAAAGARDQSLFVADRQTAGRGRRGRVWSSPAGEDIFFSLLLRPEIRPDTASMITILAALAGAEAARAAGAEDCQIKWPNDLVLHDRKVCGILTEMSVEMDEIDYVIVGVGVNLNRMDFEESIADMASSLRRETGKKIVRARFLADFIRGFMDRYHEFLELESLAPFVEEYNRRLISTGRQVKIIRRGQELIRTSRGINDQGELLVVDDQGREERILSGEVSVRGLYGYT